MKCIACAPFRWVLGKLDVPNCYDGFSDDAATWDDAHATDRKLWDGDPDRDRIREAERLLELEPERAFGILVRLAEQGSVWSMLKVGQCYYHGRGVEIDFEEGGHWYTQAAQNGSEHAQLYLGRHYFKQGEIDECETIFAAGVANDWAPALYWSGWCQLQRTWTRESAAKARQLLMRAAALGSPAAELAFAQNLMNGRFGLREIPRGMKLKWAFCQKRLALFIGGKRATSNRMEEVRPSERSIPAK